MLNLDLEPGEFQPHPLLSAIDVGPNSADYRHGPLSSSVDCCWIVAISSLISWPTVNPYGLTRAIWNRTAFSRRLIDRWPRRERRLLNRLTSVCIPDKLTYAPYGQRK